MVERVTCVVVAFVSVWADGEEMRRVSGVTTGVGVVAVGDALGSDGWW